MKDIKFNKHHVTDGITKARCHYSLDNHIHHDRCVTIYAKDYDHALGTILGDAYENKTDTMTDYFDKGKVTLLPGDEHYQAARARAERV